MLKFLKSTYVFLLFCTCTLFANEPFVERLTPPQITSATISEEIVCTRPVREGKFNISAQKLEDKTIINCYGHGGSGWTTLFGSVSKALEIYEEMNPSKEVAIRVVGSGCMGLTTAIELTRRGYHVTGIYTKSLYDLPSWRAAGYFALVSVKTSPEEQENLNNIGLDTFLTYQKIERGEHPYITKEAVRYMPVYCSIDREAGVEDLEAKGMIPPRKYVTLDFGNGTLHPDYVKYMTYFMNTTTLMRQLTDQVKKLGIKIEQRELKSFDEVKEEVIFNCSGLGGRDLNADQNMIPVRGHLVTLNEAAGTEHMDYMIYTKVQQNGKEECVYMFPKDVVVSPENTSGTPCRSVLGGTFIPNVDSLPLEEQKKLDRMEFRKMLDRSSLFFLGHPFND